MKPYVYLKCPVCRKKITQPFPRGQLTVYVHHKNHASHRPARLVVRTHPTSHKHSVKVIPDYKSIEEVLEECAA